MVRCARFACATLAVVAAAGIGPARAGNLITNGSFESPSVGGGWNLFPNGSVPGWTSNNNELEIDYTPILGGPAYDGSQSAELNGTTFDTISQTVTGLTQGASYALSWAYGTRPGSGPQEMQVYFGGTLIATDTADGSANSVVWTPNSATVAPASDTETLSFVALDVGGDPAVGNELDAVALTAIPEPVSLAVLGSGLVGLRLLRRKRG